MATTKEKSQLEIVLTEIARLTAVDPRFRDLALQDAAAALAQCGDPALPPGISVKFVDNTGPVKLIPLPDPFFGPDTPCDAIPVCGPHAADAESAITTSTA
jgi:hypothetical protein